MGNVITLDVEHRKTCKELRDMQFEHEIVLDPFRELVLQEHVKYYDAIIEKQEHNYAEASVKRHKAVLASIPKHYPSDFIQALYALYQKYGNKLNAGFYKATVEAGQKTSG